MRTSFATGRGLTPRTRRFLSGALSLLLVALNCTVARPQTGPTLSGQTKRVLLIPNNTADAGEIVFKSDRDNDGMPDDDEAANGTDPDDPSDADADKDTDGLANGDEVAMGSGVNNPDSDGDGVSDGDEARLGSSPNDPNDRPPVNATIVSIRVEPAALDLSINSLLGPQPGRLRVVGTLSTGATVDLTTAPGTTYQSQNQAVALVDDFGTAAGVSLGTTSIVVTNGALTAQVPVNVSSYTPVGLSKISIPGYPNSVDVQGTYAYIASGAAGLLVVDVSNYKAPRVVGSLNPGGNANDVKVVGDLAYVAAGAAGLFVVNVADKAHPKAAGSLDTLGQAQDLAVRGSLVYVADGDAGLQIVNVSDPAHPLLAGTFDTQGVARCVDVEGDLAVVGDDFPAPALNVVNVAQPQNPTLVGSLPIGIGFKEVFVRDSHAYVSAYFNGLWVFNLAQPADPQFEGFFGNFAVRDLAVSGTYAFAPLTQFFTLGTPIIAINEPTQPNWRGMVDFTRVGAAVGVAVAADQQYVYTTAVDSAGSVVDNGTSATSFFMIGRYQPRFDHAGLAPSVSIVTPQEGQGVLVGNTLSISADASDDVEVDSVQFRVNGAVVGTDFTFPYEAAYTVPAGSGPLTVTATAADLGGNTRTSAPVSAVRIPKPPPALTLVSPAEGATLIQGQTVNLLAQVTDVSNVRRVVFTVNGVALPQDTSAPYQTQYAVPAGATSLTVAATATFFDSTTASATRTLAVVPPDPTTVTGRVVDFAGRPVAGASVSVFGEFFAQSAADGTFAVAGVASSRGPVRAGASATVEGRELSGVSPSVAPVPGGTTNVGNVLLLDVRYETDIGNLVNFNATRNDDVAAAVQLPFPFEYYGTTYTQVFVSSNGYLTFNSADTAFNETEANFVQGRPRIAPLFDDWFPDQTPGHGVYANTQLPGRVVFTWRGVGHVTNHNNPEVNDSADFQAVLFADGRIQFGYQEVKTLGGLAGIAPGGTPNMIPFNFTATPGDGFNFGQDTALYERFTGIAPNPFDLKYSFITYAPSSGGYEMKFYHAPQTAVTGRLTDGAGNPVGGATVSVLGRSAVSSADGTFRVERVPAAQGPVSLKAVWVTPDGRLMQAASAPAQPAAAGTTDLGTMTLEARGRAFDTDYGVPVPHAAGSFPKTAYQLPFMFRFYGQSFYGQTFDRVYVNPTGHLTLTNFCVKSGCNDRFGLTRDAINDLIFTFSNSPIIAPLLSDLDPGNTGQVFVRSSPDEWVMTFVDVQRPGAPGTNTFQVVLRPDGTIRFAYNGVSNNYGHVGLSPGLFWGMSESNYTMDWTATPVARMPNAYAFFETFTGELTNARRDFDLDHQVVVFFPNDDGSYDAVRQNMAPAARSRILFEGNLEGDWDIFSLDADGRNLTNLTDNGAYDADAAFSPDRTKIAFDSYRGDPTGQAEDVYVMNADGTGVVNLTNNPADDYYPHWSPDGSKILFYSNRSGQYEIFVMNADGSGQHSLTGYPGDSIPIWSPDGSKILVESDRDGEWRLYVLNADGSNPTPLNGAGNYGGNADDFADWSPDGTKVAFHSYRNGEANIIVVDVNGPNVVNLGPGSIPKWSPDGSKILFDYGDVYVMDADGGNRVRLSEGGAFIADWSPDGRQVVYNGRYENNSATLWIVNSDGTNRRLLLDNHSLVYVDDWAISPR